MTTITKPAKPSVLARTWKLTMRGLSSVKNGDAFAVGVAIGIAAFGPGLTLALALILPYLGVQIGLWALLRATKKS